MFCRIKRFIGYFQQSLGGFDVGSQLGNSHAGRDRKAFSFIFEGMRFDGMPNFFTDFGCCSGRGICEKNNKLLSTVTGEDIFRTNESAANKRRKLALRDRMQGLEDDLTPDIIA